MRTGSVNCKSFMSGGYRIDPDIYLSAGVQMRKELTSLPYELSNVGENAESVFLGNIFSRIFVNKPSHGVPYLAASDTVLSNIETGRYIAKSQAKQLSYLMLKKNWILITCSGTLGNVTYTNKSFEGHIATHDLIRIVPKEEKVNKGTLYAFLSSKYGYNQITQSQFGGVVKHINKEQTCNIIVPVFPNQFQKEVDGLIQEAAQLRERATDAIDEAKNLLTMFIDSKFERQFGARTNTVSSKKLYQSLNLRFDPPVFINDGVKLLESLPCEKQTLGDCDIEMWYPGIFKRAYVANGYPYIKGSDMFLVNPFRSCTQLSKTRTPQLEQLWLKEGMMLISCAGVCGQVKMITKEYEDKKAIGSPDIIRLVSSDELFTTEYIFAYLQLPVVFDFMQSLKYGSVIERFDIDNVKTIPIVKPTPKLSKQITDIIHRYMDCTYRAFKAEEKAVTMVEEEIEKWNS